jgi:uncharacterized protein (TIGR02453 family)
MSSAVSKSVFKFFNALEKNNNRDWFNANKPEFKTIEAEIKQFYDTVLNNLRQHDDIDALKVFRIYRDVRFSKNKLPYKTHFGAAFHRSKPKLRGGYYVHIQPNNESFIATGFWNPAKEDLLRIRKEFEMDDTEIRDILAHKDFNTVWGDTFEGDELKTAPKGFDKTHKAIDLIKKKQFIFTKKFSDATVVSNSFAEQIDNAFRAVRPFFDLMSDVLTTDLNGVSLVED